MTKHTEFAHEADFIFYSDPGHGWLKVKPADIMALPLRQEDFSAQGQFVQITRRGVFLEEDCDAPIFIKAWEAKHGREMVILEAYVEDRSRLGIN